MSTLFARLISCGPSRSRSSGDWSRRPGAKARARLRERRSGCRAPAERLRFESARARSRLVESSSSAPDARPKAARVRPRLSCAAAIQERWRGPVFPDGWLSLGDVCKLLGAAREEVGQLIDLGYLPEPSRGGGVSPPAFIALLGRSLSNPRLARLHIAERVVWTAVFARRPDLLRAIARHRFAPGSLGEVVQVKLLRDGSLEEDDGSGAP